MLSPQWLLVVTIVDAVAAGLLGVVVGGISIRVAAHDNRLSNLEWLQTVPLDERIEARQRQRAYDEAERRRLISSEEAERLRKLRAKVPNSHPSHPMAYSPPADPFAHNGYHDLSQDAQSRGW